MVISQPPSVLFQSPSPSFETLLSYKHVLLCFLWHPPLGLFFRDTQGPWSQEKAQMGHTEEGVCRVVSPAPQGNQPFSSEPSWTVTAGEVLLVDFFLCSYVSLHHLVSLLHCCQGGRCPALPLLWRELCAAWKHTPLAGAVHSLEAHPTPSSRVFVSIAFLLCSVRSVNI